MTCNSLDGCKRSKPGAGGFPVRVVTDHAVPYLVLTAAPAKVQAWNLLVLEPRIV